MFQQRYYRAARFESLMGTDNLARNLSALLRDQPNLFVIRFPLPYGWCVAVVGSRPRDPVDQQIQQRLFAAGRHTQLDDYTIASLEQACRRDISRELVFS